MLQQQIVKVKLGALIQCSNLLHVTVTSFASLECTSVIYEGCTAKVEFMTHF